jgi:hypothetical protein
MRFAPFFGIDVLKVADAAGEVTRTGIMSTPIFGKLDIFQR